jgi:RAB protein geranylgeranyltransferase component A
MKFLKFVLEFDSDAQRETWQDQAETPLTEFLHSQFGLDAELQTYIHALTLSLGSSLPTGQGLAAIHRHLTSMGVFGPGFAAVYPKWGGISEVAQVACRAGAVGGAVYMLGTEIKSIGSKEGTDNVLVLQVSNSQGDEDIHAETRLLVRGPEATSQSEVSDASEKVSRLVVVVNSPLKPLFEVVMEGAPTPAVVVVAIPTASPEIDTADKPPVYVTVHSSDTGECPSGQSTSSPSSMSLPYP